MATTRKPAARKAVRKPAAKKPAPRKAAPAARPAARKGATKGAIARASGEVLRLAGVGTDAVARATGKAWDQWLAILDRAGAASMPHKAIASLLAARHRVPPWWSQMVAVGYEQARGLRKAHQKADGFSASASRTVGASLERLYGAWSDPKLRALWLGAAPVEVRRSTDGKSMRITWTAGGSSVDVNFQPAGTGKSRVQVEHGKLADDRARAAQKAFWGDALDRLKAMLEKAA
jgi:uncharacterized protein YndB with AHSA1/START domain